MAGTERSDGKAETTGTDRSHDARARFFSKLSNIRLQSVSSLLNLYIFAPKVSVSGVLRGESGRPYFEIFAIAKTWKSPLPVLNPMNVWNVWNKAYPWNDWNGPVPVRAR